jgi:DNA replication protein DnaC
MKGGKVNNHENPNRREPRDLSSISGALKNLGQKIQRICQECGEEFEAINLGIATPIYCRKCSEEKAKQEEEREEAARQVEAESKYRQLIAMAQIPPKWKEVTFDNSNPKLNSRAFKVAKRYAESFRLQSPSLVFYSLGNGTGKTHLAACIANYVLHQKRMPVLFKKARDLMLEIRRTFSDRGEMTEADILDKVLSVQLLVLDDVGVDPPSRWIHGTYWTVFDRRLEWQLPVVITTNKLFEGAGETLGDRIGDGAVSRLVELCQGNVIDMTGPDLR